MNCSHKPLVLFNMFTIQLDVKKRLRSKHTREEAQLGIIWWNCCSRESKHSLLPSCGLMNIVIHVDNLAVKQRRQKASRVVDSSGLQLPVLQLYSCFFLGSLRVRELDDVIWGHEALRGNETDVWRDSRHVKSVVSKQQFPPGPKNENKNYYCAVDIFCGISPTLGRIYYFPFVVAQIINCSSYVREARWLNSRHVIFPLSDCNSLCPIFPEAKTTRGCSLISFMPQK